MTKPLFKPSQFQTDIFEWIKSGFGNAVVEAVAGSGKTTTIVESLKLMSGQVLFCAYNKHIARELSQRAPESVAVSTIHAHGYAAIRNSLGYMKPDGGKLFEIIKEVYGDDSWETFPQRKALSNLADLVRQTMADPTEADLIHELIERYDIETNGETDKIVELLPAVISECRETQKWGMDFTDMVWLPNALDLPLKKFDWVCVDETQDLNASQREIVLRSVKPGGRVIAVGDSKQSIYGFAGADTDSIPTFIKRLDAKVLPLSICYRCPSSHVELAQEIVPQIQAKEGAPKGIISEMSLDAATSKMTEGDLVLCRINAPLASIALGLISRGQKAVVKGRDIGAGLINLIKKMKRSNFDLLTKRLAEYKGTEIKKLREQKKDSQADSLEDKIDTIFALMDGITSVQGLKNRIERIFSDYLTGVVCSSVHKAKGLEADRVFIYAPELMPFPRATQPWQIEQEYNLKYVALTRAKKELIFVKGE